MGLPDIIRLMCTEPAKLCGINDRKGKIAVGYDAGMIQRNQFRMFLTTYFFIQIFVSGIPMTNSQSPKTSYNSRTKPIHIWEND